MAVMVLLEAKAKPDAVDQLKESLRQLFPDTRAYDGCQGITAYTDADDQQTFVFIERWDSKEHYERYLAWRTETGVMDQLAGMLESEPRIRYFGAVDA